MSVQIDNDKKIKLLNIAKNYLDKICNNDKIKYLKNKFKCKIKKSKSKNSIAKTYLKLVKTLNREIEMIQDNFNFDNINLNLTLTLTNNFGILYFNNVFSISSNRIINFNTNLTDIDILSQLDDFLNNTSLYKYEQQRLLTAKVFDSINPNKNRNAKRNKLCPKWMNISFNEIYFSAKYTPDSEGVTVSPLIFPVDFVGPCNFSNFIMGSNSSDQTYSTILISICGSGGNGVEPDQDVSDCGGAGSAGYIKSTLQYQFEIIISGVPVTFTITNVTANYGACNVTYSTNQNPIKTYVISFSAGNGQSVKNDQTIGGNGGICTYTDELSSLNISALYFVQNSSYANPLLINGVNGGDAGYNGNSNGYTSSGSGSSNLGTDIAGNPPFVTGMTLSNSVYSQGGGKSVLPLQYGSGGASAPANWNKNATAYRTGSGGYCEVMSSFA